MTDLEELDRMDAVRFRTLPRWIAAIIWKRKTDLPPLGHLEHGFDLDDLRAWCDGATNANPAQAISTAQSVESSRVTTGPASGKAPEGE